MGRKNVKSKKFKKSWDPLSHWYAGWVGTKGSHYHQKLAFPVVLELLNLKEKDAILDIGCGTGVFSQYVHEKGATYFGIDISKRMISEAQKKFSRFGEFAVSDILQTKSHPHFFTNTFDAVTFVLSLQDIPNLEKTIEIVSELLKKNGKMIIFMKHPAFNIPRQSGWIEDSSRSLISRRIDRYLNPKTIPLTTKLGKNIITTYHYHNPLQDYFKYLFNNNFSIYSFKEIPDAVQKEKVTQEFPLFASIGALKN